MALQTFNGQINHRSIGNVSILYPQRFQKLIYLHLFTDCFIKISPQSLEQIQSIDISFISIGNVSVLYQ